MADHNPEARAEAAVRRWEPATPAPESLVGARPAVNHNGDKVQGPHLRVARRRFSRNKTGVVGISAGRYRSGRKILRVLYVNIGSRCRMVYCDRIGMEAGWKKAVAIRAEYERKVEMANATILRARRETLS